MVEESAYRYDVYLSSCPEDADWAEDWLRPRLEAAGLRVGSELDFDLGVARVVSVERAVTGSRSTLVVLSPAWVKSGWAEFESVLTQSHSIDQQVPRTLPLLLEPCQPPLRIAALNYADFTQAQRREAKLQQVIAAARGERDVKMVGATLSQFLDNRGRMLQKVQSFWVEGVLESALQGQPALDLNLVDIPNAVPKAWTSVDDLLTNTPQPLPPGTPIDELFDRHDGALLIFGGPGGGKTTLLLQLARDLLARAEWNPSYPMPIVFNLSSWGKQPQPLADWLVDELNAKYDVPQKLGRAWVAEDQIIALLDGLDEVEETRRAACVDAINTFRKEHGFLRMAVCCRQAEYERLPRQLRLGGAVLVQPLTAEQVDAYLARGGEPLVGLRAAVHVDPGMRELAQTPLMLGIMIGAYRGQRARALLGQGASGGQQKRLFAAYVDRMFARRGADPRYPREQTERWLAWLARGMQRQGQSVFLIEHLQPDWLDQSALRWRYALVDRIGNGIVIGFLFVLITWLVSATTFALSSLLHIPLPAWWEENWKWLNLLFTFIIGALFGGLFGQMRNRSSQKNTTLTRTIGNTFVGLAAVILTMLLFGNFMPESQLSVSSSEISRAPGLLVMTIVYVLSGAFAGGFAGGIHIRPRWISMVETIRWSWSSARRSVLRALRGSLIFGALLGIMVWLGLIALDFHKTGLNIGKFFWELVILVLVGGLGGALLGLPIGLISALMGGLESGEQETKVMPNQGFYRSARRAALIGTCAASLLTLVLALFIQLLSRSGWLVSISEALIASLVYGLITGLIFGGYACLSHLALRLVLWRSGAMPWRYVEFLDCAASRVFLRKVGGGYIFVHRMLLEYFADLPYAADAAPISAQAPQRAAEQIVLK